MKLIVSKAANADLERLQLFLSKRNEQAARRSAAVLAAAVESLTSFPDRGRFSGVSNIRELVVPFGSSAYVVRYTHSATLDEVVILRI